MDTRKPLSILVTDYDQCAFTSQGTHPNMLSTALLKHASEGGYQAFYGCTHRCYSMMPNLKKSAIKKKSDQYSTEDLDNNFPTYQITANFEYITRVPCLAVSTLEDSLRQICGSGYNEVIKPYEEKGIEPGDETPYVKFSEVGNYSKSKNDQLRQVAHHARMQYPNAPITLNYVDDNKTLCNKALNVTDEPNWPANIRLNIFHHVADHDNAPITPVGEKATERSFSQRGHIRKATQYPAQSLFAQPAALPNAQEPTRVLRDGYRY